MGMFGRLGRWLDDETGIGTALRGARDGAVAGPVGLGHGLSMALVYGVAILALSGLLLATVYVPSVTAAWASVFHISYVLPGGALLRAIHRAASDVLLVLSGLVLLRTAVMGQYAKGRTIAYWALLGFVGLTAATSITGYLLPWDQKGFWARKVELGITEMTPLVGPMVTRLAQGGSELGQVALGRVFALHVFVLPPLLLGLGLLHVRVSRRARSGESGEPWWPRQAAVDGAVGAALALVVLLVAMTVPSALDAPADVASDYPARPEWFLMPMFALRKVFSGPMEFYGTALGPAALAGLFAALPLVDRAGAHRSRRFVVVGAATVLGGVFGLLGQRALAHDAGDGRYQSARRQATEAAHRAIEIAKDGVPADGPLAMLRRDPMTRGRAVFASKCASCHVLADLGDRTKATAPVLDEWGTRSWALSVMTDPDALARFGRTAYRGMMPSMTRPPADAKPDDPPFKPMPAADMEKVASLLAGEPGGRAMSVADRAAAEAILKDRCNTCHLYKGEGDDTGQDYAPELFGWGSRDWLRAQVRNPATKATYREKAADPDMKGHMPRFDGDLSPHDLEMVVEFTWQMSRVLYPRDHHE
jgi:ubiquinol-cytochrome c reductase cytochrome b subunit